MKNVCSEEERSFSVMNIILYESERLPNINK